VLGIIHHENTQLSLCQTMYRNISDMSKTREQAEVLDSIDRLQQILICADIDTSRIAICGDHSSDKDSLLEALTQLPFPPRSSDMQCCATEFVTRYAANPRVYASIRPNSSRIIPEILHLRGFRYTSQVVSQSGTERLFGKAMKLLRKVQSPSGCWHDTLRIEISGPTQLPLALIVSVFLVYPQYDAYFNVAIRFARTVQDEY
jgi:hypothetical protein